MRSIPAHLGAAYHTDIDFSVGIIIYMVLLNLVVACILYLGYKVFS